MLSIHDRPQELCPFSQREGCNSKPKKLNIKLTKITFTNSSSTRLCKEVLSREIPYRRERTENNEPSKYLVSYIHLSVQVNALPDTQKHQAQSYQLTKRNIRSSLFHTSWLASAIKKDCSQNNKGPVLCWVSKSFPHPLPPVLPSEKRSGKNSHFRFSCLALHDKSTGNT